MKVDLSEIKTSNANQTMTTMPIALEPILQQKDLFENDNPATGVPTRALRVTGSGRAAARPSYAVITISMRENDDRYMGAIDGLNRRTRAVINALEAAGVPLEDTRTRRFRAGPEWTLVEQNEQFLGYRAEHKFEVRTSSKMSAVRNVFRVLRAFDCLRNHGIAVTFRVQDQDRVAKAALKRAVENANLNGLNLAKAAGGTLEKVLTVDAPKSGVFIHNPQYRFDTIPAFPRFPSCQVRVDRCASLLYAVIANKEEPEEPAVAAA